jgi:Tfp pilus assembly protein PilO
MDKHRLVMIGLGLAMAAVVGLGYVLGIQPQLSAAAAANAQTASIAAANQASELQLAKLEKDYARLDDFTERWASCSGRSRPPHRWTRCSQSCTPSPRRRE